MTKANRPSQLPPGHTDSQEEREPDVSAPGTWAESGDLG